jgi:hypothetical protein
VRPLITTIALIAVACGGDKSAVTGPPSPTPPPSPTLIRLQSDSGDYVGHGGSYTFTQANAVISTIGDAGHLRLWIRGDKEFVGYFMAPSANPVFKPGTYPAQKYPFSDATTGGLAWVGGPYADQCTTVRGSFTVDSAAYHDTTLTEIDVQFDEYCENLTAGLHGQIHWAAGDTTRPPGPVFPPPLGLWQPPVGATPDTGDYVYLVSDSGDYIGGGQTYSYTSGIGATAGNNQLTVTVGQGTWEGSFQVMSSIAKPKVGYYTGLRAIPYDNPANGAFSWIGMGRACQNLLAWVVIDRVTYDASGITALDMRFEQHCSDATPALHGAIHWVR